MDKEFSQRLEKIERSLDNAISFSLSQEWKTDSFGKLPDAVKDEYILNLVNPNRKLIDLGGKRWRPLLLILCYELAKEKNENSLSENQAYALAPLVEFAHTASLIHDDIEDSSSERRGKPAAYITYGLDTALNSGSWLYFEAPVCLENLGLTENQRLEFYSLYLNELRRLHLGQAMDIYWHREKNFFPTTDEYNAMVKCKTGTLASLAARAGFIAGGANEEDSAKIGEIAANIGMGFQVIDDVQNLTKGNPGKKRGDDIVEGKKSLPVLLHIQKNPGDREKISRLFQKAFDEGIESSAVEECINILNESGSIKEAWKIGTRLIQENCALFDDYSCGGNASFLIKKLFTEMIPNNLFTGESV